MAQGGYIGKLLEVDLSTKRIGTVPLPEGVLQSWLGGSGLAMHLLAQEVTPEMKPTDPEAPVFVMTGPLTGTLAPSSSNWTIVCLHSSVHYMPAFTQSHGDWGARLKHAGWDGIIIRGASATPVFLWIDDDKVELRDASHLWGQDTYETQRKLQRELMDAERISVACIGPAGENLLFGASVRNDLAYGCNKGSPGLAWGSKKLKAIAVRGTGTVPIADYAAFTEICDKWRAATKMTDYGWNKDEGYGVKRMPSLSRMGGLATHNFHSSGEWAAKWGERYEQDMAKWKIKSRGGWQCDFRCHHETTVTTGPFAGTTAYGFGPENIEGSATLIGVEDPGTCVAMANFSDAMGVCPSEPGHAIAMAFEMYNKGLLTKEETGGLDLTWGNHEAYMELFQMMLRREGLGAILAKPLKEAAAELGRGAEDMVMHVKGAGVNDHHMPAYGLGFLFGLLVSGAGPTWQGWGVEFIPEPDLGYEERQDPGSGEDKGEPCARTQIKKAWDDSTGCCVFVQWGIKGIMDFVTSAVAKATGWQFVDKKFALTVGERITNLQRLYALKRGYTPECDFDFAKRLLEPAVDGPVKDRALAPFLHRMREEYYEALDWSLETGEPSPEKLAELGLADYRIGKK